MHPAKSVILFTTSSGAGYGLLIFLILGHLMGMLPTDQTLGLLGFGLAFVLITGGLLSSTFHLGHPERAWRALSQWRSSWLSREGVMAIMTYIPTGIYAFWWCFIGGEMPSILVYVGLVGILASLVTVYCTAMIYASLKPVHAWHNSWVPACYQVLSLMSGAILLAFILHMTLQAVILIDAIAMILSALGLMMKLQYWKYLKNNRSESTPETATGLGDFGKVTLLEAPHTQSNYLLQEMGFQIARKHAGQLRKVTLIAGFMLPSICFAMTIMFFGQGLYGSIAIGAAVACGVIGLYVERWLFFAEAKHAVTLYYGETQV